LIQIKAGAFNHEATPGAGEQIVRGTGLVPGATRIVDISRTS
jgi:hypothetical protein